MSFDEVRFPTDISYRSEGGPQFSTGVVRFRSGAEKRNVNWARPLERWNVAYDIKTEAEMTTLITFFMARHGMAYGFRFKNHDDYVATYQDCIELSPYDGTTFQLYKHYTSGSRTLSRKITKPVAGTVHIYTDEHSLEILSNWTVDTTTGIITFDDSYARDTGTILEASFEFDIPVRFDTDFLPERLEAYLARGTTVPIVELAL